MSFFELDTLYGIAQLVIGFGFVIFVHELGHFLVAKSVGIKCTQFAIGFGQSLLTYRKGLGIRVGTTEPEYRKRIREHLATKGVVVPDTDAEANDKEGSNEDDADEPSESGEQKAYTEAELEAMFDEAGAQLGLGETEYRLNWMPLGGYVKMLGQEDMDPTAASQNPRAFNRKPVWARACVISAGVVMNLIFALIFLTIAFKAGVELPPNEIGAVAANGPAAKAYAEGHEGEEKYRGLKPGDRVTHIDDEPTDDFTELAVKVALAEKGEPLKLTVERPIGDGKTETLTFMIIPEPGGSEKLLTIGVEPPGTTHIPEKSKILNYKLAEAGIASGMTINRANDKEVDRAHQLFDVVDASNGRPIDLTVAKADGGEAALKLLPEATLLPGADPNKDDRQLLGLVPAVEVTGVFEKSPAEKAGIKPRDVIAHIGGIDWPSSRQLVSTIRESDGKPLALKVLRDGKVTSLDDVKAKDGAVGISLAHAPNRISHTVPNSPAAELRLPRGSTITGVNGVKIESISDLQRELIAHAKANPEGGEVTIAYIANVKDQPAGEGVVAYDKATSVAFADAGWQLPIMGFKSLRQRVSRDNVMDAAAIGVEKTHQFMLQTYVTILRLTQGSVPISGMRGPIGIVHEGTRIAKMGWAYLLFFLGIISVNLVVINFLPIPIVDGGLMVFLLIEKIKGSPVGPRVLTAANILGLALIGCVFLTVTYFDVARLLGF